ncbi:MAG: hypothetical protein HC826_00700 [Rhodospirillales bacterium]|nr:hypothetical protein [Rhodospirillales bacterium]
MRPDATFNNGEGSTAQGVVLGGGDGGSDIAPDALIPVFYALWDVKNHSASKKI